MGGGCSTRGLAGVLVSASCDAIFVSVTVVSFCGALGAATGAAGVAAGAGAEGAGAAGAGVALLCW